MFKLMMTAAIVVAVAASLVPKQVPTAPTNGARDHALKTGSEENAESPHRLVVHEWGTFTSFSGSDGALMRFRPLYEDDLPDFVWDRQRQQQLAAIPVFGKVDVKFLQRMETPVTYFYTDREQQVDVSVGFAKGLFTEFYPPARNVEGSGRSKSAGPSVRSTLEWSKVRLIPTKLLAPELADVPLSKRIQATIIDNLPPRIQGDSHYEHARATDSALVHVQFPQKPAEPANRDPHSPLPSPEDHFEKFLFYRGAGNFTLPIALRALGGSRFTVTNSGADPIRSLFLVTVNGGRIAYVTEDELPAGQQFSLVQSDDFSSSANGLFDAMVAALTANGLYEAEATAMVRTWQSSWFEEQGTRLFFVLPQRLTDELLPLDVEPQPDEVTRVLVGRMEILTPEVEAHLTAQIRQNAERAALAGDEVTTLAPLPPGLPLPDVLKPMGRLAEPALQRVRKNCTDEVVRVEVDRLLRELAAWRTREASQAAQPSSTGE